MEEAKTIRTAFEKKIEERYGALPEYPWARFPRYAVFRHAENRKWFAVTMTVPKEKLNLGGKEPIDIVNLKCPEEVLDTLWQTKGIFPAYHMQKGQWISVILDGSVDYDTLLWLLALSFSATGKKR